MTNLGITDWNKHNIASQVEKKIAIVLQQSLVELTSRGPTNISQLESELIIRAAFYVNLNFT